MRTAPAALTTMLAASLLLAGCGGSDAPDAGGATEPAPATTSSTAAEPSPEPSEDAGGGTSRVRGTVVDITIEDGKVTPQGDRVEAKVGETITLNVTSDADEEIHVHSEPEHSYEVAPGESISESFTVDTPGQVAVEGHHLDVTIVQLVVRP
ncbi:MAG: hypothetical protein ABW004_02155 [Aeromicrobium sp.]|jgi:major membrane immunogen (membrane-anchored lipoprotein)